MNPLHLLHPIRIAALVATAIAATVFSGCATPSKPSAMVPSATDFGRKNQRNITLTVSGGQKTNGAGASQVSDEDFASAIAAAIEKTQLFKGISAPNSADYLLQVFIVRLDQPFMGMNMTVTLETNWILTRRADGKALWQFSSPSTFTATPGDSLSGATRLRIANEGAARANIEKALKSLSEKELN